MSVDACIQQFRVTTQSGVPVRVANSSSENLLYCTPYRGNKCAVPEPAGNNCLLLSSDELPLTLGGMSTDSLHDVIVYTLDGTEVKFDILPAWINRNVTRSPSFGFLTNTVEVTTLVNQDVLAPGKARIIGAIRANGTITTIDTATQRFVINCDNLVPRALSRFDNASHNYSANIIQGWNGGNSRIEWVCPDIAWQVCVPASVRVLGSGTNNRAQAGFGYNSTSQIRAGCEVIHAGPTQHSGGFCFALPSINAGYHYLAMLERALDAASVTFSQFEINGYVMG